MGIHFRVCPCVFVLDTLFSRFFISFFLSHFLRLMLVTSSFFFPRNHEYDPHFNLHPWFIVACASLFFISAKNCLLPHTTASVESWRKSKRDSLHHRWRGKRHTISLEFMFPLVLFVFLCAYSGFLGRTFLSLMIRQLLHVQDIHILVLVGASSPGLQA